MAAAACGTAVIVAFIAATHPAGRRLRAGGRQRQAGSVSAAGPLVIVGTAARRLRFSRFTSAPLAAGLAGVVGAGAEAGTRRLGVAPAVVIAASGIRGRVVPSDRRPAVHDAHLSAGLVGPDRGAALAHPEFAPALVGADLGPAVARTHRGPAVVIGWIVVTGAAPRIAPRGDLGRVVVEVGGRSRIVAQTRIGPGFLAGGRARSGYGSSRRRIVTLVVVGVRAAFVSIVVRPAVIVPGRCGCGCRALVGASVRLAIPVTTIVPVGPFGPPCRWSLHEALRPFGFRRIDVRLVCGHMHGLGVVDDAGRRTRDRATWLGGGNTGAERDALAERAAVHIAPHRLEIVVQVSDPLGDRPVRRAGRRRDIRAYVVTQHVDLVEQHFFEMNLRAAPHRSW